MSRYGKPQHTENAKEISKLKWAREIKGFSQRTLAEASGVYVRQIQSFESGERDINNAAAITIYKLATVLGVKMEELINP